MYFYFCKTIHAGEFFTCPHVPYMNLLELFPIFSDVAEGRVNLAEGSKSEIKERIRKMYNLNYIMACNYCDGTLRPIIAPPWSKEWGKSTTTSVEV